MPFDFVDSNFLGIGSKGCLAIRVFEGWQSILIGVHSSNISMLVIALSRLISMSLYSLKLQRITAYGRLVGTYTLGLESICSF